MLDEFKHLKVIKKKPMDKLAILDGGYKSTSSGKDQIIYMCVCVHMHVCVYICACMKTHLSVCLYLHLRIDWKTVARKWICFMAHHVVVWPRQS